MKTKLLASALATAGLLAGSLAHALDTHTVTVNANVVGTCKFNAPTSTLTLANSGADIDPSLGTAATGNVNITFRCTRNATSAVAVAGVAYAAPVVRTLTSGANTMAYTLTLTGHSQAGTGFGASGTDLTLNVAGNITAAVASGAAAGAYSDSVTLDITP